MVYRASQQAMMQKESKIGQTLVLSRRTAQQTHIHLHLQLSNCEQDQGCPSGASQHSLMTRCLNTKVCDCDPSVPYLQVCSRLADLPPQGVEGEAQPGEQGIDDDNTSDVRSLTLASNLNLPVRHRPRQSSMLHITHNATSPSSSGQFDDSFKSTVTEMPQASAPELEKSPRTRIKTYIDIEVRLILGCSPKQMNPRISFSAFFQERLLLLFFSLTETRRMRQHMFGRHLPTRLIL